MTCVFCGHLLVGDQASYCSNRCRADHVSAKSRATIVRPPRPAGIAYGKCWCGCGVDTPLATHNHAGRGKVKGEPTHFLRGHGTRKPWGPIEDEYVVRECGYQSPCWVWAGKLKDNGYAAAGRAGRVHLAHRLYFQFFNGPIPEGLQLDHLCRNPPCVNPKHLEIVTSAENSRRGRMTKLTPAQVVQIRQSRDSYRAIGARFGVDSGHVSRIRSGQAWRNLEEDREAAA